MANEKKTKDMTPNIQHGLDLTNYDATKHGIKIKGPSMTKQSFKDECDVNNILKKFRNTGQIEHVRQISNTYGDFSEIGTYQENMQKILDAQEQFNNLPSQTRKRFGNDPKNLMEFILNKNNKDEAIKLGLIPKPNEEPTVDKPKETTK